MVSTRKQSIDCMQRMSVGLFKNPAKRINAENTTAELFAVEQEFALAA